MANRNIVWDKFSIWKESSRGIKYSKEDRDKLFLRLGLRDSENSGPATFTKWGGFYSKFNDSGRTFKSQAAAPEIDDVPGKKRKRKDEKSVEQVARERQERINHFRNIHHIKVHGSDVPDPVAEFDDMVKKFSVLDRLISNLKLERFHIPTPVQMQAVPAMMKNREVLVSAPTGSGKTAAFLIPVITALKAPRNGAIRAVILSPTRELAKQTHEVCVRLIEGTGLRAHYLGKITDASMPQYTVAKKLKIDILVATPKRLEYLLSQEPPVSLSSVEWLVVDECDTLFKDGKSGFREQMATIYKSCDSIKVRRALFSATFKNEIEEFARDFLHDALKIVVGTKNSASDMVDQRFIYVGGEHGKMCEFKNYDVHGYPGVPLLVFVNTKQSAKALYDHLAVDSKLGERGRIGLVYGDMTDAQREEVVQKFRLGTYLMLITTGLLGHGMDFVNVSVVINYDCPGTLADYIHQIGRSGRGIYFGKAVTFYTDGDFKIMKSIAKLAKTSGNEPPAHLLMPSQKKVVHHRKGKKKFPMIKSTGDWDITTM